MSEHEKGNLAQGLTIVDVISIGVGSAIGVSIFSIMAPAAKVAGAGMLPTLALAAIPMVVFAVVYAFMGSTVPRSGASFEWPARFIHPFVGFMVAWLRVVGNTGALILLTQVLVSYVSRAIPIPQKPSMFASRYCISSETEKSMGIAPYRSVVARVRGSASGQR